MSVAGSAYKWSELDLPMQVPRSCPSPGRRLRQGTPIARVCSCNGRLPRTASYNAHPCPQRLGRGLVIAAGRSGQGIRQGEAHCAETIFGLRTSGGEDRDTWKPERGRGEAFTAMRCRAVLVGIGKFEVPCWPRYRELT